MALSFRLRRPQRASAEDVERAVLVALHPDRVKEQPEKIRPRVELIAKAVTTGALQSWTRPNGPKQPSVQSQIKPVSVRQLAESAARNLDPASSVTPSDIELALRRQGIDWVEPFAPGRPLVPYYGYDRRPRQYDYRVGRNITTETRPDRIPFQTLAQVIDGYDMAMTCTRHIINDLISMPLKFEPMEGYEGDVSKEIQQARKFLRRPDGVTPWPQFLSAWCEDVVRFDCGALWRERDKAGRLTLLHVVDGTTLALAVDYFGGPPESPAPFAQQFIQGIPWLWLSREDLLYQPQWPIPESPYGVAAIETVLLNANTDVRLQKFFLDFFTAGAVPEMFLEAPADQADPDALAEFEETFLDKLMGDQSKRRGPMIIPAGMTIHPYKQIEQIDPKIAEYTQRRTIMAYGLTPQDLGILSDVNRATSDTQMDTQFRLSSLPNTTYFKCLLDGELQDELQLPVQVNFDTGREREDRLMEAQAHQIYVSIGAESPDEVREKVLGFEVDNDARVPRFVDSQKLGPVPLQYIVGISGKLDPETLSPVPGTVQPQDFIAVASATPPVPSEEPPAPGDEMPPGYQNPTPGGSRPKGPKGGKPRPPKVSSNAQSPSFANPHGSAGPAQRAYGQAGREFQQGQRMDRQGQPGRQESRLIAHNPKMAGSARKEATAGITAETGITGVDLSGVDLARWRRQSRARVRAGRKPRRFDSREISETLAKTVWEQLEGASTREAVDLAFEVAKGGTPDPKGRPGPWGHLEEQLVAAWEPQIGAALLLMLPALEATRRWLAEWQSVKGLPTDSDAAHDVAYAFVAATGQNDQPLKDAVRGAYRAAWLPGARAGAEHMSGHPQATAQPLARMALGVDWSQWQPTDVLTDDQIPGLGLERFESALNEWIPEMDQTTSKQVAQALWQGVDKGESIDSIAARIDQVLHNPNRARMIARTEVNRAMSQATLETYRQAGIKMWDLLTAVDPCPICTGVAASNPHTMQERSLMPPLHPNCRCSEVPA